MTWLTTWPEDGRPRFAAHATEQAAEDHAQAIVDSKRAVVATAFWSGDEASREAAGNGALSDAGGEVAPELHPRDSEANWNDPMKGAA